jgi:hypothetical protein
MAAGVLLQYVSDKHQETPYSSPNTFKPVPINLGAVLDVMLESVLHAPSFLEVNCLVRKLAEHAN